MSYFYDEELPAGFQDADFEMPPGGAVVGIPHDEVHPDTLLAVAADLAGIVVNEDGDGVGPDGALYGHCDTCGAPAGPGGCIADAAHEVAIEG